MSEYLTVAINNHSCANTIPIDSLMTATTARAGDVTQRAQLFIICSHLFCSLKLVNIYTMLTMTTSLTICNLHDLFDHQWQTNQGAIGDRRTGEQVVSFDRIGQRVQTNHTNAKWPSVQINLLLSLGNLSMIEWKRTDFVLFFIIFVIVCCCHWTTLACLLCYL